MIKKIIGIIFTLAVIAWLGLVIMDFFAVKDNKEPRFCLKNTTQNYGTKKTQTCIGLGYKVNKYYENDQLTATEFGPFFIKDKNATN